jgi:hypothetical protein
MAEFGVVGRDLYPAGCMKGPQNEAQTEPIEISRIYPINPKNTQLSLCPTTSICSHSRINIVALKL